LRFIDECQIRVEAGNGGNGCIAFRREKHQPFGGPSGGDGGRGGDVVLVANEGLGTLHDLTHQRVVRAQRGQHGMGKDCYGRAGSDEEIRVPIGTVVFDGETGEKIGELLQHGARMIAAKGGQGGRGNIHFATATDRAPRRADPGAEGEKRDLRLELKVMADVGLLGFPNVGKSTFISAVSRARPKVADYPFTTLEPHLGVVAFGDARPGLGRSFVVADIPGLIPGASEGAGLGIRFLKHLERTRVLLHLVSLDYEPGREPLADYDVIRGELQNFDPALAERPEVVCMTKADLPEVQAAYPELKAQFAERGIELHLISAVTHQALEPLLHRLADTLETIPRQARSEEAPETAQP
jgi:GTPase